MSEKRFTAIVTESTSGAGTERAATSRGALRHLSLPACYHDHQIHSLSFVVGAIFLPEFLPQRRISRLFRRLPQLAGNDIIICGHGVHIRLAGQGRTDGRRPAGGLPVSQDLSRVLPHLSQGADTAPQAGESLRSCTGHGKYGKQQRQNGRKRHPRVLPPFRSLPPGLPHAAPHQRKGGAYWMPPLFHRALRPRCIFRGESLPRLRAKTSP